MRLRNGSAVDHCFRVHYSDVSYRTRFDPAPFRQAERKLPLIEPGDIVVLHDTGAYYFSNPFYYNSLPAPAVYGTAVVDLDSVKFSVWRQQQSVDDMLTVLG